MSTPTIAGLEIRRPINAATAEILTPAACEFLAGLFRKFDARRLELLARRVERQRQLDAGHLPDFLPETAAIRADLSWRVVPPASDLSDRRTEITGPVDR